MDLGFQPIDFASFPVEELWIAPDGHLWVDSEAGLWEYTEENVLRPRTQTLHVQILGADGNGRIWALFDNGSSVAYHVSGTDWRRFTAQEGWEPAPEISLGSGIATDRLGRVWFALGRAGLRRFDPADNQWTVLRAADVGYAQPPVESGDFWAYAPHLAFTDVVEDSFGNIWVSACPVIEYSDGPFATRFGSGEGVRWFDGTGWAGSDAAAERCVIDIGVDGNGRIWLAGPQNDLWTGYNDFIRYDPNGGVWDSLPVPKDEERYSGRPAFVSRILFDAANTPWLLVEIRGGASFPLPALYKMQDDGWSLEMMETPGKVVFDPAGRLWVADYNRLLIGETAVPLPFKMMTPDAFVVDGNGRVWIAGAAGLTLWHYDIPID
jgi:streptogramin lyase